MKELIELAKVQKHFDPAALIAFMVVETGGRGFDSKTGKILIQFEPAWFRKKEPFAPSGAWSVNKVDVQSKEWIAFNNAFSIDADSAMESTSIGLGQIMGFHWKRLGYNSVGEMWDDAKKGEPQQVAQLVKFLQTDPALKKALEAKNWHRVATIYNGSGYKKLAEKYGREPYDVSMRKEYEKYSKLLK